MSSGGLRARLSTHHRRPVRRRRSSAARAPSTSCASDGRALPDRDRPAPDDGYRSALVGVDGARPPVRQRPTQNQADPGPRAEGLVVPESRGRVPRARLLAAVRYPPLAGAFDRAGPPALDCGRPATSRAADEISALSRHDRVARPAVGRHRRHTQTPSCLDGIHGRPGDLAVNHGPPPRPGHPRCAQAIGAVRDSSSGKSVPFGIFPPPSRRPRVVGGPARGFMTIGAEHAVPRPGHSESRDAGA